MVFILNRTAERKPVFKTITKLNDNSLLNQLADTKPAGSSEIILNSLTIGNVPITNTVVEELSSATSITPGLITDQKVITLNSDKDVNGINKLYCSQIYINNILLDPSIFNGGAVSVSTNDINRSELTGITPGTATASKALVNNSIGKISGLNVISTESVETNGEILVNRKNNIFTPLKTSHKFSDMLDAVFNDRIFGYSTTVAGNVTSDVLWSCWHPELKLHFATFSDNTVKKSTDCVFWYTVLTVTTASNIIYVPENNLLVMSGGNDINYSSDGVNWTNVRASASTVSALAYSDYLGMYVLGCNSGYPLYSYDLQTWFTADAAFSCAMLDVKWIHSSKRFIACTTDYYKCIVISTDGIRWDVLQTSTLLQGNVKCIGYSSVNNTIVLPTGANSGRPNRVGFYSKDGGFTFKPYYINGGGDVEFSRLSWVPYFGMFMGFGISTQTVGMSPDGSNWKVYQISSSGGFCYTLFSYNRKYLAVKVSGSTSIYKYFPYHLGNSFAGHFTNYTHNTISFNTTSQSGMLNIGNDSSNLIKFNTNRRASAPSTITLSNGVLKLSSDNLHIRAGSLTMPTGSSLPLYGLYMLNKLLDSNFNKTSSNFIKTNNGNTSISGYLSVNSLTNSGSAFDMSENISEFVNNTCGLASANKFLLTDTSESVTGLTDIKANSINIGNYKLSSYSDYPLTTVDFNNKASSEPMHGFANVVGTAIVSSSNLAEKIWHFKELDLDIVVYSSTSIRFRTSSSFYGISFTDVFTPLQIFGVSLSINNFFYIEETGMLYACTSSGMFYMHKSPYYWRRINSSSNQSSSYESISYSPSLNIYVASTVSATMISKNGLDFKIIPDTRYTDGICFVKWVQAWGLFIGIGRSSSTTRATFVYSTDGLLWDHSERQDNATFKNNTYPTCIEYSPKLGIAISRTSSTILYTYDGKYWHATHTPVTIAGDPQWFPELEIFISCSASTSTALLYYSYNGVVWFAYKCPSGIASATYTGANTRWAYFHRENILVCTTSTGTAAFLVLYGFCSNSINPNNCVVEDSNNLSLDIVNNRLGVSVAVPQFSLHLGDDLAFKPTTSTWVTSSDERLKEDILNADLNQCSSIIENIPIKEYTWNVYTNSQTSNQRQLGWVAQDVETLIPKAVEKKNLYGIEDCRTLNNDQIIANMYGAIQNLIKKDEELETFFE